jgi:hypothetical protein
LEGLDGRGLSLRCAFTSSLLVPGLECLGIHAG